VPSLLDPDRPLSVVIETGPGRQPGIGKTADVMESILLDRVNHDSKTEAELGVIFVDGTQEEAHG
jgi:hypothetical protein